MDNLQRRKMSQGNENENSKVTEQTDTLLVTTKSILTVAGTGPVIARLDNASSAMCKPQQMFGPGIQCLVIVHNFNNIFSIGYLCRTEVYHEKQEPL